MPPLNPKRRVIPNRVMRRAVTRGVDALYRDEKRIKKLEQQEKNVWSADETLVIALAALVLFLVGLALKSC